MLTKNALVEKWSAVIDHDKWAADGVDKVADRTRRWVLSRVLENTQTNLGEMEPMNRNRQFLGEAAIPVNAMGASSSDPTTGAIDTFDPILISMIRRTMPNLIAYDIMGVQPMTGPTGLIFALRSRYTNQTGSETFYNEVNSAFSSVVTGANTLGQKSVGTLPGNTTQTSNLAATGLYNFGSGMSTAQGEALGTDSNTAFPEMAFSIEKVTVTAKERALAAGWTLELAQDLKAIHGLDAEGELTSILQTEVMAEINREMVRTIYVTAKAGSQTDTTTAGIFDLDTDSNGRWMVEKFKGLMYHLEREANGIAKDTRRGRGNLIICSSDVASALEMTGKLSYTPALDANGNLRVDDTGPTFCGILNGKYRVVIDPYVSGGNFFVVGYKGATPYDAGIFYCPYVPLQLMRAVDPASFQPRIGFKTRYGVVANPFAEGLTAGAGALNKDSNVYYRRTLCTNLM
jgi:hypothetical protein